ncbi:MAG TPA: sulfur carrier protein ThiS [Phycisphaerae bacterium]|nr:sulfur carrier protein ThiS [Phycisphaerae bacterium]HPS52713.1 sulfur carrier protein ThiS [Phycisphaerae bacterium]
MKLTVNGKSRDAKDGMNIAELLGELKMNPQFVAVEVNRQLVTRKYHSATILKDGDVLEIVTLVGGG